MREPYNRVCENVVGVVESQEEGGIGGCTRVLRVWGAGDVIAFEL